VGRFSVPGSLGRWVHTRSGKARALVGVRSSTVRTSGARCQRLDPSCANSDEFWSGFLPVVRSRLARVGEAPLISGGPRSRGDPCLRGRAARRRQFGNCASRSRWSSRPTRLPRTGMGKRRVGPAPEPFEGMPASDTGVCCLETLLSVVRTGRYGEDVPPRPDGDQAGEATLRGQTAVRMTSRHRAPLLPDQRRPPEQSHLDMWCFGYRNRQPGMRPPHSVALPGGAVLPFGTHRRSDDPGPSGSGLLRPGNDQVRRELPPEWYFPTRVSARQSASRHGAPRMRSPPVQTSAGGARGGPRSPRSR
jgi:hypothetical protein